MAIRHEDVAIRRNGNAAGLIERIRAISRYALLSERHQHQPAGLNLKTWCPHDAVRALR
jgi:hypothetical protein